EEARAMALRTWIAVTLASAVLAGTGARAQVAAGGTSRGRAENETAAARRADSLEAARLGAELVAQELLLRRNALAQFVGTLKPVAFGMPGRVPVMPVPLMPGGIAGLAPGHEGPDEAKAHLTAMRRRYDELKAATLETSKKLAAAQRRVAELEDPSERPA